MNISPKNQKLLLFGESSERLLFRQVIDSDFDTWVRFCAFPDSLKYIRPDDTKTAIEKCEDWFERVKHRYANDLGGMNALICKETHAFVGQCGLLIQQVDGVQELEIGYSLMPEHRGKGYAFEAASKCRDFAFENDLSNHLISNILDGNEASMHVARKNGMKWHKRGINDGVEVNVFRIDKSEWEETRRGSGNKNK
jgi:RimJ/RimL family protein N-acetyltransferase